DLRDADRLLRAHIRRGEEHHVARRLQSGPRAVPGPAATAVTASRSARPLLLAAGVLVTVAGIAYAVRGVALADTADALADANLWWLVPSLAVFSAGVALRGLRWWV